MTTWVLYVAGKAVFEFLGPKAAAACVEVGAMVMGSYGTASTCVLTVGA